ncbi:MAG: bifunctional folylpolyglutamate synthase/dihydrofolate synthase, partial [Planctomycetes bacterium]|nr:bifunctional folylpolyglutamate synthase/dihydrofolate synthase [Planctomycetota bacterium]
LTRRVNYERSPAGSYSRRDFKLDRMRRLLSLLGNPQKRIPVIHIAGTKGKGSTAEMVSRMLIAGGYRVGLFTSPHVSVFEERMTVDGNAPSEKQLVELVNRVQEPVAHLEKLTANVSPTYFEIATAMAWLHFEQSGTQLAVLEVGMGGRLDSTNICNPEVTIITNISRDHTEFLGDTLSQIAFEKAGIIKPHVPLVSGVMAKSPQNVIRQISRENHADLFQLNRDILYEYRPNSDSFERDENGENDQVIRSFVNLETPWARRSSIPLPLAGEHQAANAALAVTAVDLLSNRGWPLPPEAVERGMIEVRCPLRIEILGERPTVLVDAAHNEASVEALVTTLRERFPSGRRILVFAGTTGKDVKGMLRLLLPEFDVVILTQYLNNPRAIPVEQLQDLVNSMTDSPVHSACEPVAAWKLVSRMSDPDELICVTGSFFLAAEMRELILQNSIEGHFNRPRGDAAVAG